MSERDQSTETQRIADILQAWADAIRADTATTPEDAERGAQMAEVMAAAALALRHQKNGTGLLSAIRMANVIRADGVPGGYDLAQVYTDGAEVVVCGTPREGEPHDCDEMGCGPSPRRT
jgi:hypothetical protein